MPPFLLPELARLLVRRWIRCHGPHILLTHCSEGRTYFCGVALKLQGLSEKLGLLVHTFVGS